MASQLPPRMSPGMSQMAINIHMRWLLLMIPGGLLMLSALVLPEPVSTIVAVVGGVLMMASVLIAMGPAGIRSTPALIRESSGGYTTLPLYDGKRARTWVLDYRSGGVLHEPGESAPPLTAAEALGTVERSYVPEVPAPAPPQDPRYNLALRERGDTADSEHLEAPRNLLRDALTQAGWQCSTNELAGALVAVQDQRDGRPVLTVLPAKTVLDWWPDKGHASRLWQSPTGLSATTQELERLIADLAQWNAS